MTLSFYNAFFWIVIVFNISRNDLAHRNSIYQRVSNIPNQSYITFSSSVTFLSSTVVSRLRQTKPNYTARYVLISSKASLNRKKKNIKWDNILFTFCTNWSISPKQDCNCIIIFNNLLWIRGKIKVNTFKIIFN